MKKDYKYKNLQEYWEHQEKVDRRIYNFGIGFAIVFGIVIIIGAAIAIPLCIHDTSTRRYEYTLDGETYPADYCYTTSHSGEFVCEKDGNHIHPDSYRKYHE